MYISIITEKSQKHLGLYRAGYLIDNFSHIIYSVIGCYFIMEEFLCLLSGEPKDLKKY